jgi:murein DD-endopeptidase MepM/ murein hydrolase activator NlpD
MGVAGVVLVGLVLIVMNQLRAGTLDTWWRAKFLNAADPIPRWDRTDVIPKPGDLDNPQGIVSPSGWSRPLEAPTISPFGAPRDGGRRRHQGIDIGGNAYKGQPIRAAKGGIVTRTAGDGRCGKRVWVDHGDGWKTLYCHLDAIWVNPGQRVAAGHALGSCGNTGNAATTPPHVHFEVHTPGGVIDPSTVVPAAGASQQFTAAESIPATAQAEV